HLRAGRADVGPVEERDDVLDENQRDQAAIRLGPRPIECLWGGRHPADAITNARASGPAIPPTPAVEVGRAASRTSELRRGNEPNRRISEPFSQLRMECPLARAIPRSPARRIGGDRCARSYQVNWSRRDRSHSPVDGSVPAGVPWMTCQAGDSVAADLKNRIQGRSRTAQVSADDDVFLARSLIEGRSEAALLAWRRFHPLVETTLRRMLGPGGDLQDLTQE